ncbi:hypothetical protein [Corynebacterium lowii]|uniref:Secreted protein n=1 Tax=Corynebacterium lowii TaxID=1544413 RepID=A0A0Q0YXC8_9CORY|nr:hypothetical protein [Corynebacterium lowii]KQB87021.1 hypothetical protein Clow_00066 [Corynebacterium lowii]MDP9852398.1 hypothetical protein [Corynebacterium lowii]
MTFPGPFSRRALLRPLSLAAVVSTLALGTTLGVGLPAQADVLPLSPTAEDSKDAWVNPAVRAGEEESPVTVELLDINGGKQAHLAPGHELSLSLRLRNVSSEPVEELAVSLRRGQAVPTVAALRQALAQDSTAYTQGGSPLLLGDPLGPGEERVVELRAATSTAEQSAETLALEAGSTYPMLVAVTGVTGASSTAGTSGATASGNTAGDNTAGGTGAAEGTVRELDTERFAVDVGEGEEARAQNEQQDEQQSSEQDEQQSTQQDGEQNTTETEETPPGLSLLYPLSEPTHIVPGETGEAPESAPLILSEDSLAHSLAAGGRLHMLLGAYEKALASSQVAQSSCLALDPALLSTVARMGEGYTVSPQRRSLSEPTRRLRDSWQSSSEDAEATPGSGVQAAQSWLERLRGVAANHCVVSLPWANADLDAVQRTANPWLMREALQRGQEVIAETIGVTPQRGVVVPGSGYVSEATVPALGWAGQESTALSQEWESAASAGSQENTRDLGSADSTLDSPSLPDATGSIYPQAPQHPVSVLVADNTVWSVPKVDRFAQIGANIRAITYPASLAATLAATGDDPATMGYSNPEGRFDPTLDSPVARQLTAASAVRRSLDKAHQDQQPMLIAPPATLSADTGAMLLEETQAALEEQRATPLNLNGYLSPEQRQESDLAAIAQVAEVPSTPRLGAPFLDPAVYSDTEVLRTMQQANYTDDLTGLMVNDPSIALSRYGFTAPLRQDLLTALSTTRRRGMHSFDSAVEDSSRRLNGNREILQDLRGSVALLPPGNVYTRTSDSSPLLIVAKNGLPLPVDATMRYHAQQEATISTPTHLRIPARGSITVQMTADIEDRDEQAHMDLWLASSDGSTISAPVHIAVHTRAGLVGTSTLLAGLAGLLAAWILFRLGRKRALARPKRPEIKN